MQKQFLKNYEKIEKCRKNTGNSGLLFSKIDRKKMGSGRKITPDMGDEIKKSAGKTDFFPERKNGKTVGYGTGTYNAIRPAALSWVLLEKAGKSRVTAKFF